MDQLSEVKWLDSNFHKPCVPSWYTFYAKDLLVLTSRLSSTTSSAVCQNKNSETGDAAPGRTSTVFVDQCAEVGPRITPMLLRRAGKMLFGRVVEWPGAVRDLDSSLSLASLLAGAGNNRFRDHSVLYSNGILLIGKTCVGCLVWRCGGWMVWKTCRWRGSRRCRDERQGDQAMMIIFAIMSYGKKSSKEELSNSTDVFASHISYFCF